MRLWLIGLVIFFAACRAKPEVPVDNTAIRQAAQLKRDVEKARESAAQAQEAVARTQKTVDEANQLP